MPLLLLDQFFFAMRKAAVALVFILVPPLIAVLKALVNLAQFLFVISPILLFILVPLLFRVEPNEESAMIFVGIVIVLLLFEISGKKSLDFLVKCEFAFTANNLVNMIIVLMLFVGANFFVLQAPEHFFDVVLCEHFGRICSQAVQINLVDAIGVLRVVFFEDEHIYRGTFLVKLSFHFLPFMVELLMLLFIIPLKGLLDLFALQSDFIL